MAVSQTLRSATLNWYKGASFTAAPTTLYCALLTTNPSDDAGTGLVEVVNGSGASQWNGYARQAITTSTGWSAVTTGSPSSISNAAIINFGTATIPSSTTLSASLVRGIAAQGLVGPTATLTVMAIRGCHVSGTVLPSGDGTVALALSRHLTGTVFPSIGLTVHLFHGTGPARATITLLSPSRSTVTLISPDRHTQTIVPLFRMTTTVVDPSRSLLSLLERYRSTVT